MTTRIQSDAIQSSPVRCVQDFRVLLFAEIQFRERVAKLRLAAAKAKSRIVTAVLMISAVHTAERAFVISLNDPNSEE